MSVYEVKKTTTKIWWDQTYSLYLSNSNDTFNSKETNETSKTELNEGFKLN